MTKKHPQKSASLEEALAALQARYSRRLAPPMQGFAYRFTIWLPVQTLGKPVFSEEQRILITNCIYDCCGGCSQSRLEGFPPWTGSWLPEGAAEPIVDHHIQFVIYTLQDAEAVTYLRQLKGILQLKQVAAQEVVLIEQVPVTLIAAAELPE
jgi:hypothetical protein